MVSRLPYVVLLASWLLAGAGCSAVSSSGSDAGDPTPIGPDARDRRDGDDDGDGDDPFDPDAATDGSGGDATADGAGDTPTVDVPPDCEIFVEVCNGRDDDCDGFVDEGDGPLCADVCCDDRLICEGEGGCQPIPCWGHRCGASEDLCCVGSEICWGEECILPSMPCIENEDCPDDEFCEPGLGVCVPITGVSECIYVPPPGEFDPVIECRWTSAGLRNENHRDVVGTPIVLNLTDDNADGLTDRNDIPDIAFLSYNRSGDGCCNVPATLRVVSGMCNPDGTMNTLASIDTPELTNDTGIAGADLDGDGVPELVAVGRSGGHPQGTVTFRRTADDGSAWEALWHNETYPTWGVHTRGGPTISIANLDTVGAPEVIIGNVVLRGDTGELWWDGVAASGGSGGVGNNAFLGPAATVADIDFDGAPNVIAGNTVYRTDGVPLWTFDYTTQNSPCGGTLSCDGFNAVGNFDDDPYGEVVIVRRGEVFVLEHDGEEKHRVRIPRDDCGDNESGPPTVADFDGDGFPEIGTASADFYVVVDVDTCDTPDWEAAGCRDRGVLWRVPNHDCSSRVTGSSVFDFDGDGNAEVVYADETNMRIFDGRTGTILFDDGTHGSHTRIEMPIIVDVDNDGNAEIVVPENGSGGGNPGVDVWGDSSDNWVRTRRIWNQHGYYVTNVTEDGTIPPVAPANWHVERLNNFRQNVQPDGLLAAPDLAITDLDLVLDSSKCPFEITFHVSVTVRNDGALSVSPGVPGRLEIRKDGDVIVLHEFATTARLFPGTSELFAWSLTFTLDSVSPPFTFWAGIDADDDINECIEDNNAITIEGVDCTWVSAP